VVLQVSGMALENVKASVLLKLNSGEYCLRKYDGKSMVWKDFSEVICASSKEYKNFVACNACNTLFSYKHGDTGTSTLKRHSVSCTKPSSSSAQTKIVQFCSKKQIKTNDKEKLLNACISVCTADLRPLCVFEGDGMREYSNCLIELGSKYGSIKAEEVLPSRKMITNGIIKKGDSAITAVIMEITKLLAKSICIAFTTDLWTDNYKKKSFFSLICHYISDEYKLVERTLGCQEFTAEKKTAKNVQEQVFGFMYAIGLQYADIKEKCYFVTDSGANMKSAFRQLLWLPCSCHILNVVLSNTFKSLSGANVVVTEVNESTYHEDPAAEEMSFEEERDDESFIEYNVTLKELIASCKDLVAYFKRVGEIPGMTTLKQEVETRWNSKLMMMQSIIKEKERIQNYLYSRNQVGRLDKINFELLQCLCNFLEPFKTCIESLEGSKYVTIHSVQLLKKKLIQHLQIGMNELPIISQLKETAVAFLNQKWSITIVHKIATFLCPKFKSLSFLSDSERNEVHMHVRQMISNFTAESATSSKSSPGAADHSYSGVCPPKRKFTSDMSEFEDNTNAATSSAKVVFDEVTKYIDSHLHEYPVGETDDNTIGGIDLLSFWKSKVEEFPGLSTLARCIFCIPASSASSERAFSVSGRVFEQRRTRMGSQTLDAILVLNSMKKRK